MSTAASDDALGPVDHLIVEFPEGQVRTEGFKRLLDLVDQQVIGVLDLEFVQRNHDGTVGILDVHDVSKEPAMSAFAGACSGLLDDEDLHTIANSLKPGSVAAVLIFENIWVTPMLSAFQNSGGNIVSENRVPVEDLLLALDRIEASSAKPSA